jgi:hypothetical protein
MAQPRAQSAAPDCFGPDELNAGRWREEVSRPANSWPLGGCRLREAIERVELSLLSIERGQMRERGMTPVIPPPERTNRL